MHWKKIRMISNWKREPKHSSVGNMHQGWCCRSGLDPWHPQGSKEGRVAETPFKKKKVIENGGSSKKKNTFNFVSWKPQHFLFFHTNFWYWMFPVSVFRGPAAGSMRPDSWKHPSALLVYDIPLATTNVRISTHRRNLYPLVKLVGIPEMRNSIL